MARIEVDTGIDYAQLDKDLADVQRRIKNLQNKIEKDKIKLDIQTESATELGAQLDEAKARLESLKALSQDNKALLALPTEEVATLPQRIAEATSEVNTLQKAFDKADSAVEKTEGSLEASNRELESLTEKEQALGEVVARNTDEQVEFGRRSEDALDKIGKRLARLAKRVFFFSMFTMALRSLRSYVMGFITSNDEAAQALGRLKGAFETLLAPLLSAIIPVFVTVVTWITRIINAILTLISLLTGKTIGAMQNTAKQAKKTAGATGKAAKSLAAFDTVQKLSSNSGGGGGGGGGSVEPIYDMTEMTADKMKEILTIVGLIGAAFASWRMSGSLLEGVKNFLGLAAAMAGLVLLIKGYLDAWNNDISMENLAEMIGGIILLVSGLYITLGPVAAGFAAIAAGVALVVLAFRDLDANGVNLYNTLTLIAGILAVGIGVFIATGSTVALFAAGVVAAFTAIMAVGGTLGKFIESLKGVFSGLVMFVKGVFTGDWTMAWEGVKAIFTNIWNAILAVVGGAVNAMIKGINFVIDKLNTLHWDVPEWVPFVGGNHWGFNFGHISEWEVPYLAQGAVIPPNRQFMAVLGDQKSGTNIEAPLDTMVQAFRMAGGGRQNINITFTGSLAELARVLKPEIDVAGVELGKPLGG